MRAREVRAMLRELEAEEKELAAKLAQLRGAIAVLAPRLAKAEQDEGSTDSSDAEEPTLPRLYGDQSRGEALIVAPPSRPLRTVADWVDHVLTDIPATAKEVARRVRSIPGSPSVLDATIRWNLSNHHENRGWIRSGTASNALWSKQSRAKEATAHA